MLNPESTMFILALLPQFDHPENGAVAFQLMVPDALFVLVGLAVTVAVAVGSGRSGALLRRSPADARWQQKAIGAICCALGVPLALQDR